MTDPTSPPAATPFALAMHALDGDRETGIGRLPEAARLLREVAPDLARILGSSLVRTRLEAYGRADGEAVRQQTLLFREVTAANLCLLGAGVLSSLVLAGPGVARLIGQEWTDRASAPPV